MINHSICSLYIQDRLCHSMLFHMYTFLFLMITRQETLLHSGCCSISKKVAIKQQVWNSVVWNSEHNYLQKQCHE